MSSPAAQEVDTSGIECHLFVRRAGLASAVGHDLKIAVGEHTVKVGEGPRVEAEFMAKSLKVLGPVDGEQLQQGRLSASDKAKIEKNMREEVLEVGRHPRVYFESTAIRPDGDGYQVEGRLTLHGTTRSLTVPVVRNGGRLVAKAFVHQPDFGIKPFRAFFGALKVKPDVEVVLTIPLAKRD